MMLLRRKALRQAQCDNDSGKLYDTKFYRGKSLRHKTVLKSIAIASLRFSNRH